MVGGGHVAGPFAGRDFNRAAPRAAPGRHRCITVEMSDGAERADGVVLRLFLPDHDPRVEGGHVGGKVQRHEVKHRQAAAHPGIDSGKA